MGRATSKPASEVVCLRLLVAYRHDVRRENLTFWLLQNYVKSDFMSNNMKMSGDMRN